MHGDTECLGNIQELCAQRVSKNWYSFVLCMNKDFRKIGVDDTITDNCLKFSGINKKRFDHCVDRRGKTLLTRNVKRSINLGLNKSCTILINRGEYKCIHDGTWKECSGGYQVDDFVRQICISYEGKNISPRCKKYFK
ncbi:hypothetical protein K502DRAFT_326106 [Neoconidiobolus thromboides FSU 785]|nr:hypothetical protein K502DRAFT_326106 [Neoconidiobolus thromboides FSU 785]